MGIDVVLKSPNEPDLLFFHAPYSVFHSFRIVCALVVLNSTDSRTVRLLMDGELWISANLMQCSEDEMRERRDSFYADLFCAVARIPGATNDTAALFFCAPDVSICWDRSACRQIIPLLHWVYRMSGRERRACLKSLFVHRDLYDVNGNPMTGEGVCYDAGARVRRSFDPGHLVDMPPQERNMDKILVLFITALQLCSTQDGVVTSS